MFARPFCTLLLSRKGRENQSAHVVMVFLASYIHSFLSAHFAFYNFTNYETLKWFSGSS